MLDAEFYRRRLPHWQPPGSIIFVTFRTHGSLPKTVEADLHRRAQQLKQHCSLLSEIPPALLLERKRLFRFMDEQLAHTCNGPAAANAFLSQPEIASLVIASIHKGADLRHYLLHRYCVMPNHVHLLIEPLPSPSGSVPSVPDWPPAWFTESGRNLLRGEQATEEIEWWRLPTIMKSLKGTSSHRIKEALVRREPVWHRENFDHWVRNGEEYGRITRYIDLNPVEAGLCASPQDWAWSTAGETARARVPTIRR